jgi:hypothetical protein
MCGRVCVFVCVCVVFVMSGVLVMCIPAFSSLATLTEVFSCFFISCKANARVKLAETGHGLHSSKLVLFVLFCCYLCCYMYCV